jgi:hypothetical protein
MEFRRQLSYFSRVTRIENGRYRPIASAPRRVTGEIEAALAVAHFK